MRVDGGVLSRHLRADRGLPDPCPAQEHALQGGVLGCVRVALGIHQPLDRQLLGCLEGLPLVRQVAAQSHDGDAQSAQVTDVFTQGEAAVNSVLGDPALAQARRHQAVVLDHQLVGQRGEGLAVLLGPPGVQVSVAVVLRPLVVKAVANLVANHSADGAEVAGHVRRRVEERRAQDRRREGDVVLHRVVERIHRLRGGEPGLVVAGLAQLGNLVVVVEAAGRPHVRQQVRACGAELQAVEVAPLIRVADLRLELLQLRQRLLARSGGHPG